MLKITLGKPVRKGERRRLTPTECSEILRCGTSVQPRYSKSWQICRDDDGSLSLLYSTKSNTATWSITEVLNTEATVLSIRLSSPLTIGDARAPTLRELDDIFLCGVSVLPGCQLSRTSNKLLLLSCGKQKWNVQEVFVAAAPATATHNRVAIGFMSLIDQHRSKLATVF